MPTHYLSKQRPDRIPVARFFFWGKKKEPVLEPDWHFCLSLEFVIALSRDPKMIIPHEGATIYFLNITKKDEVRASEKNVFSCERFFL